MTNWKQLWRTTLSIPIFALVLMGAEESNPHACCASAPAPYEPSAQQIERDNIFSLLAYAVVFKDWQSDDSHERGYNIGAVLVDAQGELVCWARNSVSITGNGTQHGEVRLITNYLLNTKSFYVDGFKLYTTLEPCAMCGGMMTLNKLAATIFGQHDLCYGDAIQRLEFDSQAEGGYCPYSRGVNSVAAQNSIREKIDQAYASSPTGGITRWLRSPEARALYEEALTAFQNFTVKYTENQAVLDSAHEFLAGVPSDYAELPYGINCPGN